MPDPFPLPVSLDPDLGAMHAYWRSLVKGANDMPFWDDFKPSELGKGAASTALLDVFDEPFRLRFGDVVGEAVASRYGAELHGRFFDEIERREPLRFLHAQASAALESSAPNYWAAEAGYARLLLPMWGNGRIEMLFCGFSWR